MTVFTEISISIVDDDAAVRDSLSLLLSIAGHRVCTYQSGADFLAGLETCTANILVVDMHMPRMNGIELVQQLRSCGSTLPVILISGNLDAATQDQAEQVGICRFLKKPFPGSLLIETIGDVVD